jgi:hypothetical protein
MAVSGQAAESLARRAIPEIEFSLQGPDYQ